MCGRALLTPKQKYDLTTHTNTPPELAPYLLTLPIP